MYVHADYSLVHLLIKVKGRDDVFKGTAHHVPGVQGQLDVKCDGGHVLDLFVQAPSSFPMTTKECSKELTTRWKHHTPHPKQTSECGDVVADGRAGPDTLRL